MSQTLYSSGVAGVPVEYIKQDMLNAAEVRFGRKPGIYEYFDWLFERKCSENGVFGAKIQYDQLDQFSLSDAQKIKLLSKFDKIILLSRGNLVAQAISHVLADETHVWHAHGHAELEAVRGRPADYNVEKIADALSLHARGSCAWRKIAESATADCLSVTYEEMTSNMAGTLGKVGLFLGLPDILQCASVQPITLKLADERNDNWQRRFFGRHSRSSKRVIPHSIVFRNGPSRHWLATCYSPYASHRITVGPLSQVFRTLQLNCAHLSITCGGK